MDDNDLHCIDRMANLVRDMIRAEPGRVRRITILWQDVGQSYVPSLDIEMEDPPEAKEVKEG